MSSNNILIYRLKNIFSLHDKAGVLNEHPLYFNFTLLSCVFLQYNYTIKILVNQTFLNVVKKCKRFQTLFVIIMQTFYDIVFQSPCKLQYEYTVTGTFSGTSNVCNRIVTFFFNVIRCSRYFTLLLLSTVRCVPYSSDEAHAPTHTGLSLFPLPFLTIGKMFFSFKEQSNSFAFNNSIGFPQQVKSSQQCGVIDSNIASHTPHL